MDWPSDLGFPSPLNQKSIQPVEWPGGPDAPSFWNDRAALD